MLKAPHSRDLENVIAHSQPGYSKPVGTVLPPGVSFASNNGFSSGPSFFERLFGPPVPPAPIGRRAAPAPGQRRIFTR
jgi:hypothetical protein